MPVRTNEPPTAIPLLDAEKAGGLRGRVAKAAVRTAIGRHRLQSGFLGGPGHFQFVERVGLAGPFGACVLAELVNQGLAIEHGIARIGLGQGDGANLERGRADGLIHRDGDPAHVGERC
jgi:hypothetical protein